MASIVKRKKKFSVVYLFTDNTGVRRQKWETYNTHKEAVRRKTEIEYQQNNETFIPPRTETVRDLLHDFVELYGVTKWALSTYISNKSLIENYINPHIGDVLITAVTTRTIDEYYRKLLTVKAVMRNGQKEEKMISPNTIWEIHKILRCAFNRAIAWELVDRNPVQKAVRPEVKHKKREIWTDEMLAKALGACDDMKLLVAMNLAFACSMRLGEITGLTWDCVHLDGESHGCYVYIEKELARVDNAAMEKLDKKDIIMCFPALRPGNSTTLVLKAPKTKTSIRRVWVPYTLKCILLFWKKEQDELKEVYGDDYLDYNLVVTHENGRPVESRLVDKAIRELAEHENLPPVVFHSLRHSSTTYKLIYSHGDVKAAQGDNGHAESGITMDIYAHTLDDSRVLNAQAVQENFYNKFLPAWSHGYTGPIESVPAPQTAAPMSQEEQTKILLDQLQQNPAMLKAIKLALEQVPV